MVFVDGVNVDVHEGGMWYVTHSSGNSSERSQNGSPTLGMGEE